MSISFDDLIPQQGQAGVSFDDLIPKQSQELTWAEKNIAPMLPEWLGNLAGGNVRGSAVGRTAMGMADPGVALAQLAVNAYGDKSQSAS